MAHLFHRTVATFIPFFLCSFCLLRAQEPPTPQGELRIGVSGGATYSQHIGLKGCLLMDAGCPILEDDHWDPGFAVGGVVEYAFSSDFSLASHLLYSTHPGSGTATLSNVMILLPGSGPNEPSVLVTQSIQGEGAASYDLFGIDLMGKATLLPLGNGGVGLALGMALGYTVRLEETNILRLLAPEDARFANHSGLPTRDDGREIVFAENSPVENASSTRFSLRGGLFYDLSPFGNFHVTPGVYYDHGLTNIGWKMEACFFQLDLSVGL